MADTIEASLESSSDRIVRVVPVLDWPVQEAIDTLTGRTELRVLLQKPFDRLLSVAGSTTDAGEATAWRNSVGRTFAVVVLGYAGSNLDAGLHDVKLVDNSFVIDRWKQHVLASLGENSDLGRPNVRDLIDGVFSELSNRRLSAGHVAEYLQAIQSTGTFQSVTDEMWRLAAFVDSHVLDTGLARGRLARNLVLIDRIRQGDEDFAQTLRKAASEDNDLATSILKYLETGDSSDLQGIELAEVESLLFSTPKRPTTPSQRSLGLFDLLNQALSNTTAVRSLIHDFQDRISESPFETLGGTIDVPQVGQAEVRVSLEFRDLSPDTNDIFQLDADPIVTAGQIGQDIPASLGEANGRKMPLSLWVSRVRQYASTDELVSLRRRLHFLQYVPSIEDTFALLLLMPRIREDVIQYCQQWQSLVSEIGLSNAPDTRPALLSVQSLEVLLDDDENPEWLALSLLHPYRLEPIARVAEYCESALVDEKDPPERLGDAALWMLDRSVPAYPAFYREQSVFHLVNAKPLLQYRLHSRAVLPVFSDSRGLQRALTSIIRYSPWFNRGASVLLIDPPPGRGVSEALRVFKDSLASDAQLIVYHAQRAETASDGLTDYDGDVVYLSNTWKQNLDSLALVDVVVLFSPESETSHMSTTESWSATPGTHMVLQLSVSKTDDVFDTEARPRIDVKPSSDNGIVNAIQDIYKSLAGGRAPHAAIEPLDSDDENALLTRLQKRTEWTITARPGPFGLVTPGDAIVDLGYVGRAASGRYLISVFGGSQVYSVRKFIEHELRGTPVAAVNPADMASRLIELARDSARSLIDAAKQPVPSLGELVGLDLASATSDDSVFAISLAMDDLGWTRAWLGHQLRPDFAVVLFDVENQSVTVRVVECKSNTSSDQIALRTTEPVIAEAITQVEAAATVMDAIFSPGGTLAEDLQFSSFIEHIFAVLLHSPMMESETRAELLDLANKLAERSLTPRIESWVFISQPSINQRKIETRLGNVNVVWLGAPEINRLLTTSSTSLGTSAESPRAIDSVTRVEGDSPISGQVQVDRVAGVSETQDNSTTVAPDAANPDLEHSIDRSEPSPRHEVEAHKSSESRSISQVPDESLRQAEGFILAMRLHTSDVADTKPRFIRVGPSLIAIGVQLVEGSSLQPIRSRLGDIAREVGLGDREGELWIENSSEPGVIQVLMPRPDRMFPPLPGAHLGAIRDESYVPLYLGQTTDGTDFITSVEKWPHILVAGTTGSGKTTLLQSLLTQFTRLDPDEVEIVIADGKGDTDYLGVVRDDFFPQDLIGVQLGADRAREVADWAIEELERRSTKIHELVSGMVGAGPPPKAADLYKGAIARGETPPIKPLVLIIDEFADIMLASKKQVADTFMANIQRLAQIGRSRLMHVMLATQRPDRNTIRGAVRANFDARIAMRLPTAADSMTILGSGGAEKLMTHGDMLFRASSGQVVRLQAYSLHNLRY